MFPFHWLALSFTFSSAEPSVKSCRLNVNLHPGENQVGDSLEWKYTLRSTAGNLANGSFCPSGLPVFREYLFSFLQSLDFLAGRPCFGLDAF